MTPIRVVIGVYPVFDEKNTLDLRIYMYRIAGTASPLIGFVAYFYSVTSVPT